MSTQISKRELLSKHALSAGLGVGSLAVLAQRASADTPFTSFPFTAIGAPTPRTMPDRLGEIKNVKDYGAVGDGVTDDTAAIQACFDAAFGPISSPGGGADGGNVPVFFPKGVYIVNSPAPITVMGAGAGAGGRIQLTVTSTSTLLTGYTVLVDGVLGTTEANGVWGITVDDATHITLYNASGRVFTNAWSAGAGQTVRTSALHLRDIKGGHIYGSGRAATAIKNNTSGGITISTNAADYCKFENLAFRHAGGSLSVNFELFSDGNQTQVACQGNYFQGIYFESADYGLRISGLNNDGQMGSEVCIMHCHFQGNTVAGLYIGSYNALQATVIGGQCQGCGIGIYAKYGTVSNIHGTGFQINTTCILLENSGATGGDAYHISGCRLEASIGTFLQVGAGQITVVVEGVTTTPSSSGVFATIGNSHVIVDGCAIHAMTMASNANGSLDIRNSNVTDPSFLSGFGGTVTVTNVRVGTPNGSAGLYQTIGRKKGGRTYDIEATATSDNSVIYAGGGSDTVTISNASPAVVTTAAGAHFLAADMTVTFTTTGTLPSPLVASQTYYVRNPGTLGTSSTFNVSSTAGGSSINTTTAGSGVHTCNIVRNWAVGDVILKSNVAAGGSPGWACTTAGPALTDGTSVAVFKALANVAA